MKIASIVGARPQFIKASVLSRTIRQKHTEILIHTGQHYDDNMSDIFFDELGIPAPEYHLGVGSGSQGTQTGAMLAEIESVLLKEQPDWVLVYGDTNSTLAGALAAVKLPVRVAHVEAGLRSYNRAMPEEINRIVTDHLSTILFCPSQVAQENLAREGIVNGVHVVGDVMYPALMYAVEQSRERDDILKRLLLNEKQYLLATVHRAGNTDDPGRLRNIVDALAALDETIVFPVHPRTRKALEKLEGAAMQQIVENPRIRLINPVGYLDMARLESAARMILTDSGGIQKEAYWLGVPCVTLRDESEWVETIQTGWNCLAGADKERILQAVRGWTQPQMRPVLYGIESSGDVWVDILQCA